MTIIGFFLALAVFLLKWGFQKSKRGNPAEDFLAFLMLFAFGLAGIGDAIGHFFYAARMSALYGYTSIEMGVANLALGTLAVLSFWMRRGFLNAALLGNTIWFWGSALALLRFGSLSAPLGVYFLVELLIPVIVWVVYFKREQRLAKR